MVDFYGLPQHVQRGWPGRRSADERPFDQKLPHLHAEIAAAVSAEMGASFDSRRFVPNVLMHEFEALLFSDCARFAVAIGRPEIEPRLKEIRQEFDTPEHINDSVETAPSKRIRALVSSPLNPSASKQCAASVDSFGIGWIDLSWLGIVWPRECELPQKRTGKLPGNCPLRSAFAPAAMPL
jgi:hypothetical protein